MIGVALIIVEIALYRFWPLLDDNDPPPSLEQQLAIAAAVILLTLPHIIARLARHARPWLLIVAGTLGIVLTALSVVAHSLIFLTIPFLLVPSIVYLVRGSSSPRPFINIAGLSAIVTLLAVGAAGAFFLSEDPRCSILVRRGGRLVYEEPAVCNPNSSGRLGPEVVEWSGTSDTVALHESLLSLALSGAAITACVRVRGAARPRTGSDGVG